MFKKVPVAACSFKPRKFDISSNADRLEEIFRQASSGKARIAVAPEGALDGYVVMPIIRGEFSSSRMNEVAISIRNSYIVRFKNLAKELGMCLVFGFAERLKNKVFNSAVFIGCDGRLCGRYHKMQFAEGWHPSWWYNQLGVRSRSIRTPYGKCGILICADRWNSDIARIPVLDGARYLIIPSFGSRSKEQDLAVLARSRENGVPIIEANVGVSLIISKGMVVACNRRFEGITFGEIDIPAEASIGNRDQQERLFLHWRSGEMARRYKNGKKECWGNFK